MRNFKPLLCTSIAALLAINPAMGQTAAPAPAPTAPAASDAPAAPAAPAAAAKTGSFCSITIPIDLNVDCGAAVSMSFNLSKTSVTAYKIAAVNGGEFVQATSSYNTIAGLILYVSTPLTDQDYKDAGKYFACGIWNIVPGLKCGLLAGFSIPGTSGTVQQYALGWKATLPEWDTSGNPVEWGIAATFNSGVPSIDPTIVDSTGMVKPALAAAVASGDLLPTKTGDRWGLMVMVGVDTAKVVDALK
ncbi:MAG TPA: hypothetical protein VHX92_04805 [Rhizomicrobium sp.]|jgi:hypothetical protein|nr:hypothetical protein [Rhizomicrobium sp.]